MNSELAKTVGKPNFPANHSQDSKSLWGIDGAENKQIKKFLCHSGHPSKPISGGAGHFGLPRRETTDKVPGITIVNQKPIEGRLPAQDGVLEIKLPLIWRKTDPNQSNYVGNSNTLHAGDDYGIIE